MTLCGHDKNFQGSTFLYTLHKYIHPPSFGMGPTPESAGITAQPGLRYRRVASPIEFF